MGKKKVKRTKHVPQRTCIGCREVTSKRGMIRLVQTEEGVLADPTGKMPGRGVYLHPSPGCWEIGLNGAIAKGLLTVLTERDKIYLNSIKESMVLKAGDGNIDRD